MLSIARASLYPGRLVRVLEPRRLDSRRGIQASFYGPDMAAMLRGLLAELTLVNIGAEVPTYVRNDNPDAAYQVDSGNTATGEKQLNGFLESNRGAREE